MIEIEQDSRGYYGLCVFDAEHLADSEVLDVFEKFGEVVNIHRPNNLTFVRYGTLEEAVSCYEGMKNDNRFRVKPAKNKSNPENQRYSNFNQTNRNGDMNRKKIGGDSCGRGNERSSSARCEGNGRSNSIPELVPLPPPELLSVKKVDGPEAKLAVIAHLPPAVKQCDIYELCSKAKATPLHVAMKKMERPPYPTICYAYVYLKDEHDLKEVVSGLNNIVLNGYRLVVNSANKLAEEGAEFLDKKC